MQRTIRHSLWLAALVGAWTLGPDFAAAQSAGSGSSSSGSSQSQSNTAGKTPGSSTTLNPAVPQPGSTAQPGASGNTLTPGTNQNGNGQNSNGQNGNSQNGQNGNGQKGQNARDTANGLNPANLQANPQATAASRANGPARPGNRQTINPGTGPLSTTGGGLFNPGTGNNRSPSGSSTPATPGGSSPQGAPGSR